MTCLKGIHRFQHVLAVFFYYYYYYYFPRCGVSQSILRGRQHYPDVTVKAFSLYIQWDEGIVKMHVLRSRI